MAAIVDIYGNPLRTQQLRKQQTAHLGRRPRSDRHHLCGCPGCPVPGWRGIGQRHRDP